MPESELPRWQLALSSPARRCIYRPLDGPHLRHGNAVVFGIVRRVVGGRVDTLFAGRRSGSASGRVGLSKVQNFGSAPGAVGGRTKPAISGSDEATINETRGREGTREAPPTPPAGRGSGFEAARRRIPPTIGRLSRLRSFFEPFPD